MQVLSKQRALEHLRARIESIEKRQGSSDGGVSQVLVPARGFPHLPAGALHEVFTAEHRNAGASLGFALGAAGSLIAAERRAIVLLQLRHDGAEMGVVYGPGLAAFGVDPAQLVLCLLNDPAELLWALEEATVCTAVAAVIADIGSDIHALDFTVSRRLSLRANASGSSVFLLRYGRGREASASRFRWRIDPVVSGEKPFDARAPDAPRWLVDLEKGRLGARRPPLNWTLDWTENGFALVDTEVAARADHKPGPPLSDPQFAALGDRLSQTG